MKKHSQLLVTTLKDHQLTLALAESMTCGLAAHRLSGCIGTSDVLKGSIVCYSPELKCGLMQVSEKMIDTYTCESKEVTEALVKNLSKVVKADVYAAITGLASPGGSETKEKPVGTVFFSIRKGKKIHNYKKALQGSPLEIKKKACETLYKLILSALDL